MTINLHRGTSLISRLIQWQTRSPYSHASLSLADNEIYESREGHGVRCLSALPAGERIDQFDFPHSDDAARCLRPWLISQLGKPYDWTMVLRFITREQYSREAKGHWFCSELVYAALRKIGIELLARCEPWEVSPGLLSRSPLLKLRHRIL